MSKIKSQDSGTIRVADITIAQLSRGLYRSTATAFKELISNAYDADATEVRIDTNFPEFDFISCVDNGSGMSLDGFLRFFDEDGIGSSIKRKNNSDRSDKYNRPLIGRLGIGMLAIGQLCHSFKIESHYIDENGEGKAFKAEIVLLDDTIPDKEKIIRNEDVVTKEMDVGEWQYETIAYDASKQGFRLYSSDVRSTFRQEMKMRGSVEEKLLNKMSFRLPDLHNRFFKNARTVRDCKPYLETIWELSILCPLPYYHSQKNSIAYPFNERSFESTNSADSPAYDFVPDFQNEQESAISFLQQRQRELLEQNFHVVFDGIELRRMIELPTDDETIPMLYFVEYEKKVYGVFLKFSGYIFAQIAKAVRPLEMNGVQIRLRNVGIGGYDSTFLHYYEQIPTIRKQWVSGEIFVDQGLESALNIDRDSFNEHDEHFKTLQFVLHKKLQAIFNEINALSQKHNMEKRKCKEQKVKDNISDIVDQQSAGKLKVVRRDLEKSTPAVVVDRSQGEIVLNTSSRELKKKRANELLQSVMLAYHTAKLLASTDEERDQRFSELLKEVLGKLV